MKLALFAGGQPRFNSNFFNFLGKLNGFDSVDIYLYLWNTKYFENTSIPINIDHDFFIDNTLNFNKIISLLPENFNLKVCCLAQEPKLEDLIVIEGKTIEELLNLPEGQSWNINRRRTQDYRSLNFVDRLFKQYYSIYKSYKLIEGKYDCLMRFRVDMTLQNSLNINDYDITKGIFTASNLRYSESPNVEPINDQFAFGNTENMEIYFNNYYNMQFNFFEKKCLVHQETSLSYHLQSFGVPVFYPEKIVTEIKR